MYLGNFNTGATVYVGFNTVDKTNGAPITLAGTPVAKVYKGNSTTTEVTTGVTLSVDNDSLTGHHVVTVDTSADGTFYAAGGDFRIVLTAGTVDSVSVVGTIIGSFSIEARAAKVSGYSTGQSPVLPARSNTAQAGGSTSITLDASASSTTDIYAGSTIYITGGTGAGQARLITAYNGTTKVATVATAWATNPDNTSTFSILPAAAVKLAPVQSITSLNITNTSGDAVTLSGSTRGIYIESTSTTQPVVYIARGFGVTSTGAAVAMENDSATNAALSIINANVAGTGEYVSGGAKDIDANQFGSVTGNVVGNLTGSVGSIASAVTVGTNNDKTGYTATVSDKTGFKLASDGLDPISVTAPTTVAATFPQMVNQLWRRFFKKVTKTSTQIRTYGDDGSTVYTTSTVSDDGTTQTQGPAT